jgi:tRNA pseudouridine32 synthase/23S rRNA pseudouridine746 synthase
MAQGERHVYLVSDLEAEANGVILVGHQKRTATYLNKLQRTGQIKEFYRIEAQGEVDEAGELSTQLDKQDAITHYQRIGYNDHGNSSKVDVQLQSGVKDQLRRHFASIEHGVIGDPVYGENNDNHRGGIRMRVTALELQCPVKSELVVFSLY